LKKRVRFQFRRNEACVLVRRSDEEERVTENVGFLRSRHD
jgi:hypothetical protein